MAWMLSIAGVASAEDIDDAGADDAVNAQAVDANTDAGAVVEAPPPPPPVADKSDKPIVVWPTLTPSNDDAQGTPHKPTAMDGPLYRRARDLDATLQDAVQDLGFTVDVADVGPRPGRARELDMIERAAHSTSHEGPSERGTWVVSARLESLGGDEFLLRVVTVGPRSKQLRVRIERVSGPDVSVRGLVMLRDLLSSSSRTPSESGPKPEESADTGILSPIRSPGRAVLAVNAALFGAFTAYSIQRASGSDDPRLLYPLLTLGTGIGIGGALLVAEEWDVRTGDAWTLAGGAWWGAASGLLIANGRNVLPLTDRYAWGIGGGLIGLGYSTFILTRGHADEGDAALVHSGAALGFSLGALGELYDRGSLDTTGPATGSGYGTAIGLLGGATLSAFVTVSPSRVLLVDLGAGVGAAGGAALASPLIFDNLTEAKTRGFLAATTAGMLVGGGVAWWLTRDASHTSTTKPRGARIVPTGGVIGSTATRERDVPAYGFGVRGVF